MKPSLTLLCARCGQAKELVVEGITPQDSITVVLTAVWSCWHCHQVCGDSSITRNMKKEGYSED